MKTTLRLALTLLLCFIACMFIIPSAFAETVVDSGTCGALGGNLTWVLYDDGELVIEGSGAMEDYGNTDSGFVYSPWMMSNTISALTINNGVTSIGDWAFYYCDNLKDVSIANSVTKIGSTAFANCQSLKSISIPNSVTSIGSAAFSDTGLTELTIPDSVTSIGVSAFYGCGELSKVTIPGSVTEIEDSAFYACDKIKTAGSIGSGSNIEFGWNKKIPNYAFSNCRTLERISIPEGITTIGDGSFSNCYSLIKLTIPKSVTDVAGEPYYGCDNLTTAGPTGSGCMIEYGWIDSIPPYAFHGCKGLASITIPYSITRIGTSAFTSCNNLTDVYYGGTQAQWNSIYFGSGNNYLTSAAIHYEAAPTSIIDSGTCGAQGDNLTWALDNKGTLTISGTGAMLNYDWTGTTPPTRPWADYQNSIIELVVNDGVTALGRSAFYRMNNMQRVVLPEGIVSLPFQVFALCVNLSEINFPSSLTTLENECLFCTGIDTLLLPATVTSVYGHFYGGPWGSESKQIETAPNHTVFSAIDGVLFTEDLSTLVMYPCCDQTTYTVPDGTVEIRGHAFAYNFTLETLRIPSTVRFIGDYAFLVNSDQSAALHDIYYGGTQEQWQQIDIGDNNEPLTSSDIHYITPDLILPSDLTDIEEEAFSGDAFVYPKLSENTISIRRRAFADCPNLAFIYIPEATTSIDPNAFENVNELTVLGKAGSTAETYAGEHDFLFTAVP